MNLKLLNYVVQACCRAKVDIPVSKLNVPFILAEIPGDPHSSLTRPNDMHFIISYVKYHLQRRLRIDNSPGKISIPHYSKFTHCSLPINGATDIGFPFHVVDITNESYKYKTYVNL